MESEIATLLDRTFFSMSSSVFATAGSGSGTPPAALCINQYQWIWDVEPTQCPLSPVDPGLFSAPSTSTTTSSRVASPTFTSVITTAITTTSSTTALITTATTRGSVAEWEVYTSPATSATTSDSSSLASSTTTAVSTSPSLGRVPTASSSRHGL